MTIKIANAQNGLRFQCIGNIQGFLDVVIGLHRTYENRLHRMASALAAEIPRLVGFTTNGLMRLIMSKGSKADGEPKSQADGKQKLKNKDYLKELRKLQEKLCHLQDWVKFKGLRVIIVFEGRDAAGKGGAIKALTERVSPRVFRVAALPAPSDREKGQMYIQRYVQHFPTKGEVVIFDRSWYNRAGVESVLGFCTPEERDRFLEVCPGVEKQVVRSGIQLIKIWLESSDKEQKRRFEARIEDPLRQWKLSPVDLLSRSRWFDYSRARDLMLKATDTEDAPWYILHSDDKKRARLNCLAHILGLLPYKKVPREKVQMPKRSMKDAYDDQESLEGRKFVAEKY